MQPLLRRVVREPLWVLAALWPLALLTPFLSGLPKPSPSGLPWRQEFFIAALLTATLLLLRQRARRVGVWPSRFTREELYFLIPHTLFIAWSAASLIWAERRFPALQHTLVWILYLFFALLMCRVARRPRLLRVSLTMLAAVVSILSLCAVISSFASDPMLPDPFRSVNGFSEMLAALTPIFAALALRLRRGRAALLCAVTAILSWAAILQVPSRASFIGAGVALVALAFISLALRKFRPRSFMRAALLGVAFVSLPFLLSQQKQPTALTRLGTTSTKQFNTQSRMTFWKIGFEMLRDHPLTGVGGNNYGSAFADARAEYLARHPGTSLEVALDDINLGEYQGHRSETILMEMGEQGLVERAHNEYVQILTELGVVGFALFLFFCLALACLAFMALRRTQSMLVPGALGGMLAFAISSSASSASFRWLGGGLAFFFAAALLTRFAGSARMSLERKTGVAFNSMRTATACALVLAFASFLGTGAQGLNFTLHGAAQESESPDADHPSNNQTSRAEQLYRAALVFNPFDAATHFNYGVWLYYQRRAPEAIPHLRYGTSGGMIASSCYAYQAAAEVDAGDALAAEHTLSHAAQIYPHSVFLRVRHAIALAEINRMDDAEREYAFALAQDAPTARGWRLLMCFGIKNASAASLNNPDIAPPGALYPNTNVFPAIAESEHRLPDAFPKDDLENPLTLRAAAR